MIRKTTQELIEKAVPFLSPLMTNGSPSPPTVEGVQVVTDASGSWSNNSIPDPVAYEDNVHLRAVVELSGAPQQYYWGDSQQGTVSGIGTVYPWDSSWGTPTITWKTVLPTMNRTGSNDPWNTNYNAYANKVSESNANVATCPHGHKYTNPGYLGELGLAFGQCSSTVCCGTHTCSTFRGIYSRTPEGNGYDTIEYNQTGAGSGWEITEPSSTPEGTRRYRISAFTYNGKTVYSPGKEDMETDSNLVWVEGNPDRSYDRQLLRGIMDTVTRIVRLSNNPSPYLKHVDSHKLVPWILASTGPQADHYIGFDCADLAVAAARKSVDPSASYTSANGLKSRPVIGDPDERYYLENGKIKRRSDGKKENFTIGVEIKKGDLILIDYDRGGVCDHTTILYAGSGVLDGDGTLVMARKPGVIYQTLNLTISSEYDLYLRKGW